ncbi:hypothetical protein ASD04_08040 [Devosia sp. Root436]|uniref:hypothetical protein n=1 Tax=Devosia sp. Root436 TaxID=1736537 RepID=UPI0006F1C381|nr:hypothetical protein [Devosia sp. Root436]KQX38605.1 hypothetical protein ASD04_08040 [Devosia sp. Root436]
MIGYMRRLRLRLLGAFSPWLPASDTTVITLRPMPGDLHRDGRPTEAFWQHLVALCGEGWLVGAGHSSLLPTSPDFSFISATGRKALRPFGKLVVVTELAMFDPEGPRLLHLVCTNDGVAVATATSQVSLAVPMLAQPATRTLVRAGDRVGSQLKSVSVPTR